MVVGVGIVFLSGAVFGAWVCLYSLFFDVAFRVVNM